jgi:DNA-binding XRE family transcriptional regulator
VKYPNIEAERVRAGMSKEMLAQALGVTRKTLYNWLTKGKIPPNSLERMAVLFNCTTDYLLGNI